MYFPNSDKASVPRPKLAAYLLSDIHPVGRSKARFFHAIGFTQENVQLLEKALLNLVKTNSVTNTVSSEFGTKYVVDGLIQTPVGRTARLRTVWLIEVGQDVPRFVTAYPV